MEIIQENVDGYAVLGLSGRLDGVTSAAVEAAIQKAADAERGMVIDCANLRYISSIGLRVVLTAAKLMQAGKKRFVVCGVTAPVREVFDISGFSKILEMKGTREEATK